MKHLITILIIAIIQQQSSYARIYDPTPEDRERVCMAVSKEVAVDALKLSELNLRLYKVSEEPRSKERTKRLEEAGKTYDDARIGIEAKWRERARDIRFPSTLPRGRTQDNPTALLMADMFEFLGNQVHNLAESGPPKDLDWYQDRMFEVCEKRARRWKRPLM